MKNLVIALLVTLLVLTACAAPRQKLSPQANVALKTANVYYSQRDTEQAQQYYQQVLADNPNHVLALTRLGDINLHNGETYRDRSIEFNKKAYENYALAVRNYEQFTDLKDEDYLEIRNIKRRMAGAYARIFTAADELKIAGNSRDALAAFEIAAVLDSTRFEPLYKMKEIYMTEFRDTLKAEQLLVKVYNLKPNDIGLTGELAGFYYNAKKYNEALIYFNKIKTESPNDTNNLLNIAACHAELKDYRSALTTVDQILNLEPNNETALLNASMLAGSLADNNARIEYLKRLITIRDNDDDYNAICALLSQAARYDELITYGEKWHNYDETSKFAVQYIIYGADKLNNRTLKQRYETKLRGMQ